MTGLDGIARYRAFFNGDPGSVNKTIQLMVLNSGGKPPEWLRGLRRFEELPRVDQKTEFGVTISIALLQASEIAQRARWVIEYCSGRWNITKNGFGFESVTDAVLFRLRWDQL